MSKDAEHSETGQPDPWRTSDYVPEGKSEEEMSYEERGLIFGSGRKEFGEIMTRHELQALLGDGPIEDQTKKYRTLREARKIIKKSQGDDYVLRIFLHSRILGDPKSHFEHWMEDPDGPEWVLEQVRDMFGDDDSGGGGEPPTDPTEPAGGDGTLTFADFERETADGSHVI